MDPDRALLDFIIAATTGDLDGMSDAGEKLVGWIAAGGFPPNRETIRDALARGAEELS